ncbi:hypothetical protein FB451DRAFT_1162346 [Mycena latifolia]|nr:hypothetical protein FB451DRAFT_1162346 [Mycena latifolia]
MAIVRSDTFSDSDSEESLDVTAFEELCDGMYALPFVEDDPSGEFGERRQPMRDLAAINYVAAECWRALRIAKKPENSALKVLTLFPQMHIDIVLEVLGHLHPLELIQVSCVNKAFRGLLLAPITTVLWRSAFDGHPPLPMCPPEISPRRWAKLLFGPRQCEGCGALNTLPDYRIWRQLCTDCMNVKLCSDVPKYPSSHEVNSLVAKTFRIDGSESHEDTDSSTHGWLWPADGTAVAEKYEGLKAETNPRLEEDGPPGALEAFIDARKTIVQATYALADETESWLSNLLHEALQRSSERHEYVINSARKRLIQEGHDPRDVLSGVWATPSLERIPRLTSKRWNKARPHILPLVDTARTARLARERALLVTARTSAAVTAASHVLRTAPRETWPYNPPGYTIETFAPLRGLIDDPSTTPLADDDARLADALLGLPAFVEAWRTEKRVLLASLLPGATDPPDVRTLELATSVFTCLGSWVGGTSVLAGRSLIGWEGAGAHLRCRSLQRFWERRVHFASEGAAAARELVRLVGLDPATATAEQMDRLCGDGRRGDEEKRFLCARCDVEGYKRVRGRRAMRWRECVLHTIERTRLRAGDAAHRDVAPAWVLLTDAGAEDVRRREAPDPVAKDNAWVCALCTVHYEGRVTLTAVIEHVREGHNIRAPVKGQHFIYFSGAERTPRVPALLSLEGHVAEYRCNRCPQGKLRSLRTIKSHVSDKHDVAAPGPSDWTLVERILRSTEG